MKVRLSGTRKLGRSGSWFGVVMGALAPLLLPSGASTQDLFQASRDGRLDQVESILSADPGAVRSTDASGYTALHWAAIQESWDVFQALLEAGSDVNAVGGDGGSPLHWAAHHDRPDMVALLLDEGADPGLANQWGRTALHTAARRNCTGVAGLLLDRGADPDAITQEGWSTLNVAYRAGHASMVELLLARGASPDLPDPEGRLPGEVALIRPGAVEMNRRRKDEYVGRYETESGFAFFVWRVGGRMRLRDFADDDMIPVGEDEFYCVREPWRVVFSRDSQGRVTAMDVAFQRQTIPTRKVLDPSGGIAFVGTQACLSCHSEGPGDGPAGHWIASRHSRAFHTLSSDQAKGLAASREDYRDIEDPSQEERCIMCHVTAAQNSMASFEEGYQAAEGVGCESCHGPGSAYMAPEIMADREAFLANGGRIPDQLTCRACHRDEAFVFTKRLERIRHW